VTPSIRLVENDASIITLQDVYEVHCKENSVERDDPIVGFVEKLRALSIDRNGLVGPRAYASPTELIVNLLTGRYCVRSRKAGSFPGDIYQDLPGQHSERSELNSHLS